MKSFLSMNLMRIRQNEVIPVYESYEVYTPNQTIFSFLDQVWG